MPINCRPRRSTSTPATTDPASCCCGALRVPPEKAGRCRCDVALEGAGLPRCYNHLRNAARNQYGARAVAVVQQHSGDGRPGDHDRLRRPGGPGYETRPAGGYGAGWRGCQRWRPCERTGRRDLRDCGAFYGQGHGSCQPKCHHRASGACWVPEIARCPGQIWAPWTAREGANQFGRTSGPVAESGHASPVQVGRRGGTVSAKSAKLFHFGSGGSRPTAGA